MDTPRRSIFREEAIRRYRQAEAKTRPVAELPIVPQRVITALWLLLGLLLVAGMVCWFLFEAF